MLEQKLKDEQKALVDKLRLENQQIANTNKKSRSQLQSVTSAADERVSKIVNRYNI